MSEPVDRLRRLATRASELGADGAWLAERLGEYLNTAAEITLDDCLGLRPEQSQPSWRTVDRRRRREELIRRLVAERCPNLTRHQQAKTLAEELRRYQSTAWVRDRHSENPPTGYSRSHVLMFKISQLGEAPNSWRAIWQVIGAPYFAGSNLVRLQK
jgi:hypothetical protein